MANGFSIGNLKFQHPIIQGGMGVGVSLSNLAGNVSKNGCLGIISTAQIGFNFEGFSCNPLETNLTALSHHIKKAKEIAMGNPIGVNIMAVTKGYERYVEAAIMAGIDVIISGAGLPINLPKLICDRDVKFAPIVSSKKACDLLLKNWDKKLNKTADFIVVEGPKAGGHLGFSIDDIEKDFTPEIPLILESVKPYEEKYGRDIPVIFAGGVYTKEDIKAYMDMGISAVQIASRFVCTHECDAHYNFKKAYLDATPDDIVIVKSPVGLPGRAIKNKFMKTVEDMGRVPITKCYSCLQSCKQAEIPYCISRALINSVMGNVDEGLVFASETVGRIKEIVSVSELIKELTI